MSAEGNREDESYFRSEEMSLCQLYMKTDAVYNCVCELGELGLVQFNNVNDNGKLFEMKFAHQTRICANMDRAMRFIEDELRVAGIHIPEVVEACIPLAPQFKELLDLQVVLENLETELSGFKKTSDSLQIEYLRSQETAAVLQKVEEFFIDAKSDFTTVVFLLDATDLHHRKDKGPRLGYLTGTIPMQAFFTFERVLWRVCRGNYYLRHAELEHKKKFIFTIFFQGKAIREKIRKICQAFKATLFQCPEVLHERLVMLEETEVKIRDLEVVLQQTDTHRREVLESASKDLPFWRVQVRKAMAVFHIMNHMSLGEGGKHLIAECWIPTVEIPRIQEILYKTAARGGFTVPPIIGRLSNSDKVPPTYNRSNPVLRGFQNLVDSYGIGEYRELNPAAFTIVSFPFLFGVMFGDLGHGTLVAMLATFLVTNEKSLSRLKLKNEIWNIIFEGRYIILGMGLFSMFTGSVYNDVFSKSMKFFDSAWKIQYNVSTVLSCPALTLDPRNEFRGFPYPFGVDPVWNASGEAAIIAMNSFKMKLAIILGATQMLFGLLLGARNHIFFGRLIDLWGMCIPQIVFFSLFLYLVAMIFMKWAWYSVENSPPYDTHCAPSLLITFIDMLLFKRNDKVSEDCTEFMFQKQFIFQRCLVIVALLCVPVMLLSKPLYVMVRRRQKKALLERKKPALRNAAYKFTNGKGDALVVQMTPEEGDSSSSSSFSFFSETDQKRTDKKEDADDLSEVFINQAIHTIEAVLGAVSHTASYLRLWALSLAHDQLSTVLWNMVLRRGLMFDHWAGGFFLCFVFVAWAVLTVAILVVMEGLSAFLHTLRLHWVEFQSKFYSGSGRKFEPFDFKEILSMEDQEE